MRELVVAETATATWHYHLREVRDGRTFFGGGAPPALCGTALGWDVLIPLESYDVAAGLRDKESRVRDVAADADVV